MEAQTHTKNSEIKGFNSKTPWMYREVLIYITLYLIYKHLFSAVELQ